MKKELFIFTSFYISILYAQDRAITLPDKQCDLQSRCIRLARCPILLEKALSNEPSLLKEVRDDICGFRMERMYVCCHQESPPILEDVPHRPIVFESGSPTSPLPTVCGQPSTEDRIFGGEVAPIGSYPWMVAIGFKITGRNTISFDCSGSIISSRYVLTAAHCLNAPGIQLSVLNVGDWDLGNSGIDCEKTRIGPRCASGPHITVGYEKIIIHEEYNKRFQFSDDIALIRLDREIDFNRSDAFIQPVCIPPAHFDTSAIPKDMRVIAAGWGFTEHGNKSNILLRVEVPLGDRQKCKNLYKEMFTSTQICAGGEKGFDSCAGDSGGPLIVSETHGPPYQQIGIVSFGPRICGQKNIPAVYTSVAKYRRWIENNIKP